ncbi:hypothetical protein ECPA10_5270, partial [Escherichia coli PA10]
MLILYLEPLCFRGKIPDCIIYFFNFFIYFLYII